jgi:hypothetical protein
MANNLTADVLFHLRNYTRPNLFMVSYFHIQRLRKEVFNLCLVSKAFGNGNIEQHNGSEHKKMFVFSDQKNLSRLYLTVFIVKLLV